MPVARTSFSVGSRVVPAGAHVDPDDPVLRGRRHLFDHDVEQATAAPGEKRNVTRADDTCGGKTAKGDSCSNKAGEDGYCHLHGDG